MARIHSPVLLVARVVAGLALVAAVWLGVMWALAPTHPTMPTTTPSLADAAAACQDLNPGWVAPTAETLGLECSPQLEPQERRDFALGDSRDAHTRWPESHRRSSLCLCRR